MRALSQSWKQPASQGLIHNMDMERGVDIFVVDSWSQCWCTRLGEFRSALVPQFHFHHHMPSKPFRYLV